MHRCYHRNATALADVVRDSRSLMEHLAKAKTAKLSALSFISVGLVEASLLNVCRSTVRTLLDFFTDIPGSGTVQIEVTKENIEWAKSEKRIFLKQNLETRLVSLFVHCFIYQLD
jgi:26S proteasome regulatory subunit N6